MAENMKPMKNVKIPLCELCGEPAARKICNTCRIFMELEDTSDMKVGSDEESNSENLKC